MRPELFLDFETRSRVDLRRAGAYRYAADPSTEVLCAGWALGDGGLVEWTPTAPLPLSIGGPGVPGLADWRRYVEDPEVLVVAHNAEFERLILIHKFGLRGPAAEPSRFRCTAAQAARAGLPRSLDLAGRLWGIEHLKDAAAGKRLVSKLSRPRRASKANPDEFWEPETAAEDFEALGAYNIGDVAACRELYRTLPALSAEEQRVWEMTVAMNDLGLQVDRAAASAAQEVVRLERARLEARWLELTGVPANSPKAAKALGMESIAKVHVRHALRRQDLPPKTREALQVRQRLARSSVRKLVALEARTSEDGRLRGNLIYAGAERTARWSGGGVQLHNLPRGLGEETELAVRALGVEGALPLLYDDPMRTVSELLKGLFVGPFLVGDFAQVEARVLLWLAGDEGLGAFARGEDVYSAMASDIYGHPVTKSDYDEQLRIPKRQLGKVAVLGCGYGLGWRKLQEQLDANFDVAVDEETARRVVWAYRDRYSRVPQLWNTLERLASAAVTRGARNLAAPDLPVRAGVEEVHGRKLLRLVLPSGRPMLYFDPRVEDVLGWDDEPRRQLTYLGRNIYKGGAWERVSTYGGKLAENVVQAVSRDLLVHSMTQLDRAGFPLALTVHDEVVAEAGPERLAEFTRLMQELPAWAAGLPLAVETFATRRYRK